MSIVFIPQPPPVNRKTGWAPDFSSAEKYGKIQYIFDAGEKVYMLPTPSLFKARKILREGFDWEKDYILWPNVGDPLAIMIFMIALTELEIPQLNVLYWNRKREEDGSRSREGFYVPLKINIKEKRDAA